MFTERNTMSKPEKTTEVPARRSSFVDVEAATLSKAGEQAKRMIENETVDPDARQSKPDAAVSTKAIPAFLVPEKEPYDLGVDVYPEDETTEENATEPVQLRTSWFETEENFDVDQVDVHAWATVPTDAEALRVVRNGLTLADADELVEAALHASSEHHRRAAAAASFAQWLADEFATSRRMLDGLNEKTAASDK